MKYLLIALLFASCASDDTQLDEYNAMQARRDTLKTEYNKVRAELVETDYSDSSKSRLSYRLEAQIDRVEDSLKRLKEQIELGK